MPDWVYYDNNRSLTPALRLIDGVASELNLTDVIVDFSKRLYLILVNKHLTIGRKREALVGACVYISCQGVNYPVKLIDLCKSLDISKRELIRQKKHIKKYVETNERGISVESYINRYGYQLRLEQTEITHAMNLSKIINKELMNRTTQVKAATCLYLVVRNKVSIRGMARATGLSISAIHSSVKQLKNNKSIMDLLINNLYSTSER